MINCGTVVDLTPVSVAGEKFSDKAMLERAEFFKKNFMDWKLKLAKDFINTLILSIVFLVF